MKAQACKSRQKALKILKKEAKLHKKITKMSEVVQRHSKDAVPPRGYKELTVYHGNYYYLLCIN